jgi:hypothetical protein
MLSFLKSKWAAGLAFCGLTGSVQALTNDLTAVETEVQSVITAAEDTFDLVIPIIMAVVGLSVILFFGRKIFKAK